MKKSYITILILSIIDSIVLAGIIIFLIIGKHNPIDSSDIFKNNIDSIVEVKATTSDVGESYGSGVIYSSDGYLIPNAHVVSYTTLGEIKMFETYEITQTWVEVRGNKIRNGGVNLTPKPWNPLTGLSGQN